MKKGFKSLMVLILMFALSIGVLTGCSAKEEGKKNDEKKTLIVGLDDTFVPMGFKNESGEIVGFDVDLAKEVGKRIGMEIKFQPIDWSMKETELTSKKIDLIWNGYTITDERKEKVLFSNPYIANRQIVITLSDSNVNSKNDLKGKKVAIQNGSSSVDAVNKEPDLVKSFDGGQPVLFETNNEALMDLENKRVDAVVADEILARYYIKERGSEKYKILQEDFGKEEYGIGARKEDKELVDKINKSLEDMKKDGAAQKISEKWFAENIMK